MLLKYGYEKKRLCFENQYSLKIEPKKKNWKFSIYVKSLSLPCNMKEF